MRALHFWFKKRVKPSKPTDAEIYVERQPTPWQRRFFRWIDKRSPIAGNVQLTRSNLYIFPSATGLCFFVLSFILWLLGTSYQNNLVLALSYLLISLILVAIFHTYANLAGLKIKVLGAKPTFVSEIAYFDLQISGIRSKGSDNLIIHWWNGEEGCFDFDGMENVRIKVGIYAPKRGILHPGKLKIESVYPLGIIRCWTWLNIDAQAVIFPKPLKVDFPRQLNGEHEGEQGELIAGGDDFLGLKEYRPGDPVKHISWKHYAREQGLYSKEYASASRQDSWLEWNDFSDLLPEDRLRAICYWVLQFEKKQIAYGLRLPSKKVKPALGDGHRLSVLSALACFDINQGGD